MTKKRKTARKNPKSAAAKEAGAPARKASTGKPARTGGTHVSFGLQGMTKIVQAIHEAGLGPQFNKALSQDDKFVKVPRKSLSAIKKFVASKPALSELHKEIEGCDCPSWDPGCIYI